MKNIFEENETPNPPISALTRLYYSIVHDEMKSTPRDIQIIVHIARSQINKKLCWIRRNETFFHASMLDKNLFLCTCIRPYIAVSPYITVRPYYSPIII